MQIVEALRVVKMRSFWVEHIVFGWSSASALHTRAELIGASAPDA